MRTNMVFPMLKKLVFVTLNGVIVEVPKRILQTFKEIFMDQCYLAGGYMSYRCQEDQNEIIGNNNNEK